MGRLQRSDKRQAFPAPGSPPEEAARRKRRWVCTLGLRCAGLLPSTLTALLLAGCSDFSQTVGIDPLLGGPPLRPAVVAAPQTPAPAPLPVLPLPPATSTMSTAALAAGAPRPLDNGQDLRIGSPIATTGNDGWARQGSASNAPDAEMRRMADSTGATLQPPQPLSEPAPNRALSATATSAPPRDPLPTSLAGSSSPPGVTTFEQAEKELEARGVFGQQLDMTGPNGEWKFSCLVPNRQNPRLQRRYDARASDPVAAIRAVLEKLDKDQ
ncbi:MAG TPA: hypothetical protein VKU02_10725 [Gemmataceae bacterium]|nr:hypothetical protein [Gemmataceae bacterium]